MCLRCRDSGSKLWSKFRSSFRALCSVSFSGVCATIGLCTRRGRSWGEQVAETASLHLPLKRCVIGVVVLNGLHTGCACCLDVFEAIVDKENVRSSRP